ncbi:MAG: SPFH domain-containing protein, partial [Chloroflexi bacterium]|nr:SPFH domain-containing protein [Chloroflexota bacterium]
MVIIGVLLLYCLRPTATSDFWYRVTYIVIPVSIVAVIVGLRHYIFHTVRTNEIGIIERAGRFYSVATPGLVLLIPFLESVRIFPTTEQRYECDERDLLTRDGVAISVNMAIHYQLQEPVSETVFQIAYRLPAWEMAVHKQAIVALHQQIGSMTSDEVMQTWPYLGEKIKDNLQITTQDWGVHIAAIQLFNLRIPENLRRALEDS